MGLQIKYDILRKVLFQIHYKYALKTVEKFEKVIIYFTILYMSFQTLGSKNT